MNGPRSKEEHLLNYVSMNPAVTFAEKRPTRVNWKLRGCFLSQQKTRFSIVKTDRWKEVTLK